MQSAAPKADTDPVVAEVEGQAIHLSEVGDTIRAMPGGGAGNSLETLYPLALQQVIARQAVVRRAQADGVAADPTVARHVLEAESRVLERAYLHREAAKRVTNDMLSSRYNAEIKGKPGPEEAHARVILVATEAAGQDIIAQLAAGADFAALARQSSKDASSAMGGDLGFVRRDMLGPELGAVVFALRPGEVSPYPVRAEAGWFVVRTEARRPGPTPAFVEVRDLLEAEAERAEVPAVVRAALTGLTIRSFDMNGR